MPHKVNYFNRTCLMLGVPFNSRMKPWENCVSDSLSQSNILNKNIIEGKLSDKQGASSIEKCSKNSK